MDGIGMYYADCGNHAEMIKYYKMASERGHFYAAISLAEYYRNRGEYDEIEKYYEMVIGKNIRDDQAIEALALHHYSSKNYDSEIKYSIISIKRHGNKSYCIRRIRYYLMYIYPIWKYMSSIIKYLIEFDIDIRVLTACNIVVDDIYVKLYDIMKENIELEKEILELKLKPPEQRNIENA